MRSLGESATPFRFAPVVPRASPAQPGTTDDAWEDFTGVRTIPRGRPAKRRTTLAVTLFGAAITFLGGITLTQPDSSVAAITRGSVAATLAAHATLTDFLADMVARQL